MATSPDEGIASGWTADDSTFGARLALIRQRMQWGNVKEAAVACGLPVESWRTWERDGVAPRKIVEISEQIAERTGCDYVWLLTGRREREGRLVTTANSVDRRPDPNRLGNLISGLASVRGTSELRPAPKGLSDKTTRARRGGRPPSHPDADRGNLSTRRPARISTTVRLAAHK